MRKYTIKAGDTLFTIAAQLLGDGNRWKEIAHPDGAPYTEEQGRNIHPGEVVLVPNI